ncbi:hypothetical protein L195_g061358, partial [Trifolium pratense]
TTATERRDARQEIEESCELLRRKREIEGEFDYLRRQMIRNGGV